METSLQSKFSTQQPGRLAQDQSCSELESDPCHFQGSAYREWARNVGPENGCQQSRAQCHRSLGLATIVATSLGSFQSSSTHGGENFGKFCPDISEI